MIKVFIGYDDREPAAYHTCVDSIIRNCSEPLEITPLALNNLKQIYKEAHLDGSNDFVYTRFLVPYLCGYKGHAIYIDGDMVVQTDIAALWARRSNYAAVQVVKHDYKTKVATKYLGNKNEDYPRKNWSSLILWNCANYANRKLHPDVIRDMLGKELHRFSWLEDDRIHGLPLLWNWLDTEYEINEEAHIIHYTLGTPCFRQFSGCDHAGEWHRAYLAAMGCEGERVIDMVERGGLHE